MPQCADHPTIVSKGTQHYEAPARSAVPALYRHAESQQQAQLSLTAGFISIFMGFFFLIAPIMAIVMGHRGRAEIRATGQEGKGHAITGLILGYFFLFFWLMMFRQMG